MKPPRETNVLLAHTRFELALKMVQNAAMDSALVIETLRRHERELKDSGIAHLRLFGSVARRENTDASDVDLLAELDPAGRFTVLTLVRLESRLSELLGAKVDLACAHTLKEPVRQRALREAIHAF